MLLLRTTNFSDRTGRLKSEFGTKVSKKLITKSRLQVEEYLGLRGLEL
jgi:hypothetical protein